MRLFRVVGFVGARCPLVANLVPRLGHDYLGIKDKALKSCLLLFRVSKQLLTNCRQTATT